MNICFIGFGSMAKAIANGLLQQGTDSLTASSPSLTTGVNKDGIKTYNDNKEAVKGNEVIILAVKPLLMNAVLAELAPALSPNCLVISVAAGLSLSWFNTHGLDKKAVIRTMPNTPAAVSMAATPLIANEYVNTEQKNSAERIFSSIGITTWAQHEEEIDGFTALCGSGPAYVFAFIQAMIDAATDLGLDEPTARLFALQTFDGAIKLAKNSDLSLNELKSKVTSPGGTTEAALNILTPQLNSLIFATMNAAKQRSMELGNQ